ncbi:MAG: hypothetical protein K0U63_07080 [Cyanobacteria bacterium]|nr:hypothetical protein [Cyanobacteriota bacterium]
MLPPSPDQRSATWIQISMVWRWPLAVVLSSCALGIAINRLLAQPLPVGLPKQQEPIPIAIRGAVPITIQIDSSSEPVAIRSGKDGGLRLDALKLEAPIQADVRAKEPMAVKGTVSVSLREPVSLAEPVKIAEDQAPIKVEMRSSGEPIQVDVRQADVDLLP